MYLYAAWGFAQTPASGLPARVAGEVDVTPRGGHVRPLHAKGTPSLFALIARVKDTIVVHVPVEKL